MTNVIEHYVVRFVRQMGVFQYLGVSEDHLILCTECKGKYGKGPLTLEPDLTHFIDNDTDCGWSVVHQGSIGRADDRVWFHYDCDVDPNPVKHVNRHGQPVPMSSEV